MAGSADNVRCTEAEFVILRIEGDPFPLSAMVYMFYVGALAFLDGSIQVFIAVSRIGRIIVTGVTGSGRREAQFVLVTLGTPSTVIVRPLTALPVVVRPRVADLTDIGICVVGQRKPIGTSMFLKDDCGHVEVRLRLTSVITSTRLHLGMNHDNITVTVRIMATGTFDLISGATIIER